jgi:hypothetical protein
MGIDTRFFGPSGWQLFHLIAFRSDHPENILNLMQEVLPCKFCRASTAEFVKQHPLKGDPGKWLYDIHNMVNNKLRTQCKDDPAVIDPGVDPKFEEVKQKYLTMKLVDVPGRDFLFSIAANYPETPEESDIARQKLFIQELSKVFPFKKMRKSFQSYLSNRPVELANNKEYMKWMYGLLYTVGQKVPIEMPSYRGYVQRVMYYSSGCDKKTYKGKTCRRVNGSLTKNRDNKRTRKVSHSSLL